MKPQRFPDVEIYKIYNLSGDLVAALPAKKGRKLKIANEEGAGEVLVYYKGRQKKSKRSRDMSVYYIWC